MKKTVIAILVAAFCLAGCSDSVSKAEYDALILQKDSLAKSNDSLGQRLASTEHELAAAKGEKQGLANALSTTAKTAGIKPSAKQ